MGCITSAKRSSTRELSLILGSILTLLKDHFQNYCNMITKRTGRNIYFSVRDSNSALLKARPLNNYVQDLITADFSSLFTNLDHDIIITNCFYLVDLCYRNSKKRVYSSY